MVYTKLLDVVPSAGITQIRCVGQWQYGHPLSLAPQAPHFGGEYSSRPLTAQIRRYDACRLPHIVCHQVGMLARTRRAVTTGAGRRK